MKEMIAKGHVYSGDPNEEGSEPVTMQTPLVKEFFANPKVKWSQLNQSLFDELYSILEEF